MSDKAQENNEPIDASADAHRDHSAFRDYEVPARSGVAEFYAENHRLQTYAFAAAKRADYGQLARGRMGVWDACEHLNELIDDSDPDTSLSQIEHLLQTAEAARADNRPDWFILTALIHDLGKVLCLNGEPQWAVVGDTFPLGCPFDPAVIYFDDFKLNPDQQIAEYQQGTGIYAEGIGFDSVLMSWGHDEYLYQVVKDYLPEEALYIIRFHSFYAAHHGDGYTRLMNEKDRRLMPLVKTFSSYDLYSKGDDAPDVAALRPYYESLINRFFPEEITW